MIFMEIHTHIQKKKKKKKHVYNFSLILWINWYTLLHRTAVERNLYDTIIFYTKNITCFHVR